MKEKLKELTKDTAIYGISTMLGRFLNFLLVPFYTNTFIPSEYGVALLIFSYIAIFNIIFVYGMDAAFLKFASFKDIGDEKDNFSTPFISVFITSVIFSGLLIIFRFPVGNFVELNTDINYIIILCALILFFDSNSVISFLKLRLGKKAKLFSFIKLINIFVTIIFNIIFILKLKWGIEAIFISNLIASILTFVLLLPTLAKYFTLKFHTELFKNWYIYNLD